MAFNAILLDLVLIGLEGTDNNLWAVPFPESHERLTATSRNIFDQGLVHSNVNHRVHNRTVNDLEIDVIPRERMSQSTTHGHANSGGRNTHENVIGIQASFNARCDLNTRQ